MPYRKHPFITGQYYHLYNRGVAKQDIFRSDQDYRIFTKHLFEDTVFINPKEKPRRDVKVLCYCLMPNHFYLLVQQKVDHGIVSYLQRFLTSYSMYFNYHYGRVGPLYQGRTQSKPITDYGYFIELSRYIHRNPLDLFEDKTEILRG